VTGTSREKKIVSTFVTLADSLVVGFDVVELLQTLVDTCTDVLEVSTAGLMLADVDGNLGVVASTSEAGHLVDLIQLSSGSGPCVDSYRSGVVVSVPEISALADQWPLFAASALEQGFHAVHAVPLRLRGDVIGTMNLFSTTPGALGEEDSSLAQGLADVATIAILQERALREHSVAREQLQGALVSRVIIEQAKGVISQLREVDMDEAFSLLRQHARSNRLQIREVSERVVARTLVI